MIEAVGERYWPTYFAALDRLLKPGGRVGLQSITMPHDRMLAARGDYSWMHKYVFPGGAHPVGAGDRAAPGAAHDAAGGRAAQPRASTTPRTLAHWRENFLSRWEAVAALGFDSTFRRMWEFYLAYCEAGFRVGYLDVFQFSLATPVSRPVAPQLAGHRRAPPRRATARPDPRVGRVRGGRPRRPRRRDPAPRARCGACCGAPASWGSRGRSSRVSWTVEGDVAEGLSPVLDAGERTTPARGSARRRCSPPPALALRLGAVGPGRGRPRRRPASTAGCTPAAATGPRSPTTTTSPTTSTPSCSTRRWPTPARYWTQEPSPSYGLVDAQRDKLDLICRKLALRPGMRLLDVGCGWASLLVHAAQHYGVRATGVTLSAQQRAYGLARVDGARPRRPRRDPAAGLPRDRRRAVRRGGVDRDGRARRRAQLPRVRRAACTAWCGPQRQAAAAADVARRGGVNNAPGGGPFMERYVAPDMHMRPLGATLGLLEAAGLEVRGRPLAARALRMDGAALARHPPGSAGRRPWR